MRCTEKMRFWISLAFSGFAGVVAAIFVEASRAGRHHVVQKALADLARVFVRTGAGGFREDYGGQQQQQQERRE